MDDFSKLFTWPCAATVIGGIILGILGFIALSLLGIFSWLTSLLPAIVIFLFIPSSIPNWIIVLLVIFALLSWITIIRWFLLRQPQFNYDSYTSDSFLGIMWFWQRSFDNSLDNITAHCPTCDTLLKITEDYRDYNTPQTIFSCDYERCSARINIVLIGNHDAIANRVRAYINSETRKRIEKYENDSKKQSPKSGS